MSLPQTRAASRERECAKILGSARHIRKTKGKAPDVVAFRLANGDVVQPEVKNGMKRCPRVLVKALEQAKRYAPGAVPIAVFSDVGGHAIGCVDLKVLARWMGVQEDKLGVQLCLPLGGEL